MLNVKPAMNSAAVPLCVDLDGTLTPIDTLHENLLGLVRQSPGSLLHLPFWLLSGKARLKREVASRAKFDATNLPLNRPLIEWLESERSSGRRLVLATAADSQIAQQVASEVNLFDEVISSNGENNLSAESKRVALVERFGERGFDYVGNEKADMQVWRSARKAIVVGNSRQIERARQVAEVER
jgi:hypothetical protein